MVKIPSGCITIDRWENVGESGTKWCHTIRGLTPVRTLYITLVFLGF